MSKQRGVRVVKTSHSHLARDVDVFDLETGAKLLNVYQIDINVNRGISEITIVTSDPFVYEGPATLISPEEHKTGREMILVDKEEYQSLVNFRNNTLDQ